MPTTTHPGEYRVPEDAVLSQCRSCHAAIYWTTTPAKRNVPLSAVTVHTDERGVRWALSHFTDCPHAHQHRRAPSAAKSPAEATATPPDQPGQPAHIIARGFPTGPGVDLLDQLAWLRANNLKIVLGLFEEPTDDDGHSTGPAFAVAYVAERNS